MNVKNRLTKISFPDGTSVEFTYDAFGRRTRIVERLTSFTLGTQPSGVITLTPSGPMIERRFL